jgi:hypothetical protein
VVPVVVVVATRARNRNTLFPAFSRLDLSTKAWYRGVVMSIWAFVR